MEYPPHIMNDTMLIIVLLALTNVCLGDVSHVLQALRNSVHYGDLPTTTEGPPKHYNFEYKAGRYAGNFDRVQNEAGDDSGRVRGSYSFIDPNSKVRTVQYTVDENGYNPSLRNYNDNQNYNANLNYNDNINYDNSDALIRETVNHRRLWIQLANFNGQAQARAPQATQDTPAVAQAKNRHHYVWNKIADEHARIHEAASFPHYNQNQYQSQYPYYNQYHNYNRNI